MQFCALICKTPRIAQTGGIGHEPYTLPGRRLQGLRTWRLMLTSTPASFSVRCAGCSSGVVGVADEYAARRSKVSLPSGLVADLRHLGRRAQVVVGMRAVQRPRQGGDTQQAGTTAFHARHQRTDGVAF